MNRLLAVRVPRKRPQRCRLASDAPCAELQGLRSLHGCQNVEDVRIAAWFTAEGLHTTAHRRPLL